MGLFDSYLTPVADIPTGFGLAPSSVPYAVVLTDVKLFQKKNGAWSTILTFKVDPSEDQNHRAGKEDIWITKPVSGTDNADVHASVAKQWLNNLGIPARVYEVDNFEIHHVKDKLVGNVRGHLLITADGDNTKKKFTRTVVQGTTGPSEVEVPEAKTEEPLDFDKLLAEQGTDGGKW